MSSSNATPIITAVFFVALGLLVIAWFTLVAWVFRRLKTRHQTHYAAMGSPTLFWNNSLANGAAFLNFLWGGSFRDLDDPQLSRVCIFMRGFIVLYAAVFGFAFLAVLLVPLLSANL